MDANQSLNTQDILDSIDMNMINMNDKKKRGRPKKNNNIINTNLTKIKLDNPSNNNEQEEITTPVDTNRYNLRRRNNTNNNEKQEIIYL